MWSTPGLRDLGVAATLVSALLSFGFWLLVIAFDFHEAPANAPEAYVSYFQQVNWWPYPFFFLALAPGLWLTWRPMLRAWRRLADTGVLLGSDAAPDEAALQAILDAVRRKRRLAVVAALAVAVFVNTADWLPRYGIHVGTADFDKQLAYACSYPSPSVKWIFTAQASTGEPACADRAERQADAAPEPGVAPPPGQIVFNAVLVLQQFLIVLFAALAVAQILLHTLLFAVFERLAVARENGFRLLLNGRSPLNEFGLEHWNHTLNNFYWAVSPAMLAVFLSRISTSPEDYLPGQVMLGIAVPACLIAPMVATIIVRQARLPAAWKTVQPQGPVAAEDFRRQQLWPLDRNWSSKLGILFAFGLAALSLGFELSQFTGL